MDERRATRQPHDALFRGVFGDPRRAAELLRSVLPGPIGGAVEWASLRPVDATFVDGELRASQADLLFQASVGGQPTLVYMLLEHKADDDRGTAFQLLRYMVRIWEAWQQDHPAATRLPPVLPYVLHHGAQAWRSPRNVRELIDLHGVPEALADLQPSFTFVLDDLGAGDETDLLARSLTVQSLLPLLHLQQLRRRVATATLLASWRRLHLLLRAMPDGQHLLDLLVSYVAAVSDDPPDHLRSAYARIDTSMEERFMTSAGRLVRESFAEGLAKGVEQGRIETLLRLLETRFGPLPDSVAARVRGASPQQLGRWTERILTAPTLVDALA